MIEFQNFSEIKNRFASLISKLHFSSSLSLDHINHFMIYSDFINLFEKNNINFFINTQLKDLAKKYFNVNFIFEDNTTNPVYWAGLQYISISFNYLIPLRQLFAICPLPTMVSYFPVYHEMNNLELTKKIINEEYINNNILRKLRKDKNYTIKELAVLTNIATDTIKGYERTNEAIYNASLNNIIKIANALNVSLDLFYRKSLFIPLSKSIFKDLDFNDIFINNIKEYYKITNDFNISFNVNDEKKNVLIINENNILYVNNKKIVIEDHIFIKLFKISLLELINKKEMIYF